MRYEVGVTVEAPDFTAALLIAIRTLSRQLQAQLMNEGESRSQHEDEEARKTWN